MIVKEFCQYVRSYSELEGLQHAHTLYYSARRTEMGIVLELAQEQSGSCTVSRVLCPGGRMIYVVPVAGDSGRPAPAILSADAAGYGANAPKCGF